MRRLCAVLVAVLTLAAPSWGAELRKAQKKVPGQYIVVLKSAASLQAAGVSADSVGAEHASRYGVRRRHVYRSALQGYSAALDPGQLAQLLADERVDYIEEDQIMKADATQTGATWGLDRIDQRDRPLSTTYNYDFDGSGVHAYIVDTGVRASHVEFTGRMGNGFTSINDGQGTNDCAGHGTHVAGTVGGTTYGVAKRVTLHAVRVLDCGGSGTNAGVIAGVDWVRLDHVKPAVANMSLGGGASSALDTAVANAVAAGVTFAVAAGNENSDACTRSPARTPSAITVGSTTNTDARSSFSNWGTCVDIFGPGSSITSSWFTSNTATNTISGTSMATPHVAGVVALFLSQRGHTAPATVASSLNSAASLNKLTGIGTGSPNRLLYSFFPGVGPTPTPQPTATPTLGPTVPPTPTPATPTPPPSGLIEITPPGSAVTASANDGNLPSNAVDNNVTTRWSANGDGQWLQLDLGSVRDVAVVGLAVYNGNSRRNLFDIQVSTDGASWSTVFSGQSSGTTTLEQNHDVADAPARYVRYLGHGSTVGTWNSVSELSVFMLASPPSPTPTSAPTRTPTPTPVTPVYVEVTPSTAVASTDDGNVPGNAVDNNLGTRWSGNGDGAWLELDLGSTRTLGYVSVAAHSGNTRRNRFDVQVATSPGVWMTILSGAQTSGTTTSEEPFDFGDVPARWVRYVGHGNTDPAKATWNSVAEISLFAAP